MLEYGARFRTSVCPCTFELHACCVDYLLMQVMSKVCSVIDFIVIHSYPVWDMDYNDYANDVEGKLNFQVRQSRILSKCSV